MTNPVVSGLELDPTILEDGRSGYAARVTIGGYSLPRFVAYVYACVLEAYAQVLAAAAGLAGTSASSVAIGTGAKSFTDTGKTWQAGMILTAYRTSDVTAFMVGTVTSYNSTTGALVLAVTETNGAGTFTDWTIALSGQRGPTGSTGPTGPTGPIGVTGSGSTIHAANNGTLATASPRATLNATNSIEVVDDPANDRFNVRLKGDTATPGAGKVYGTDGAGAPGWIDSPHFLLMAQGIT